MPWCRQFTASILRQNKDNNCILSSVRPVLVLTCKSCKCSSVAELSLFSLDFDKALCQQDQ
jgi:hypothetical protein